MKQTLGSITLLLIASCILGQDVSTTPLVKFTSDKGKYTISFPKGNVNSSDQETDSDIGKLPFHVDMVEFGESAAFLACYNDYPVVVKSADTDKLLDGVINGNKGKDGNVVKTETITFGPDKLPGRKVLIKKPGDVYMRNLIVLKGSRLYQVMVVANEKTINHAKVEEYYKSFALSK